MESGLNLGPLVLVPIPRTKEIIQGSILVEYTQEGLGKTLTRQFIPFQEVVGFFRDRDCFGDHRIPYVYTCI